MDMYRPVVSSVLAHLTHLRTPSIAPRLPSRVGMPPVRMADSASCHRRLDIRIEGIGADLSALPFGEPGTKVSDTHQGIVFRDIQECFDGVYVFLWDALKGGETL